MLKYKVEVLGSRQSIVTSRGGISARDFDSKTRTG